MASITGTRTPIDQHGRKWLPGLSRAATASTTGGSGDLQGITAVSNAVDSHATDGSRPAVGPSALHTKPLRIRPAGLFSAKPVPLQLWAGWLLNGCGGAGAAVAGPLLWQWKDSIDRAFMQKYGSGLRLPAT